MTVKRRSGACVTVAVGALAELSEGEINRGVVLEDGRLAGFVSITDLARAFEVGTLRRRRHAGGTA